MSDGYLRSLDLCFIDTETGGFDAEKDALLSVAALRTDPTGKTVKERLFCKIAPSAGLRISPEAAAINGYSPLKWQDAIPETNALARFRPIVEGAVWWGHNPAFDQRFMEAAVKRRGLEPIRLGWRYVFDTAVLSWPLVAAGLAENTKLQTILSALRVPPGEAHTADADCEGSRQIFLSMMRYADVGGVFKAAGLPSLPAYPPLTVGSLPPGQPHVGAKITRLDATSPSDGKGKVSF